MTDQVILVNEQDQELGFMEKMEAHRKGLLHRAFSVLLFNSKGEVLLQKRSATKYHSAGLWTNACCSHPLPGERMEDATRRKLMQEMGIDLTPKFAYKFIYKTNLEQGMIEHEYDHVFVGVFDGSPNINNDEVESWKYMDRADLKADMIKYPEKFTYWFKLIMGHSQLNSINP